MSTPAPELAGPWPYAPGLLQHELDRYLADARQPATWHLPTRCQSWTVRDISVHLLCTFDRFRQLLARGRAGDYSSPFPPGQLAAENQLAVRSYQGTDPCGQLRAAAEAFITALREGEELMPHQLGPIPVALQVLFGISELAIHHDDVAVAAGYRYQPAPETLATLRVMWQHRSGRKLASWDHILRASGRKP